MKEFTIRETDSDSVFAMAKRLILDGTYAFQIKDENGKWLFEMNCFNGEYGSMDCTEDYANKWLAFVNSDENKTMWDKIDCMNKKERLKLASAQLTESELSYAKSCWDDEENFKEYMNEISE